MQCLNPLWACTSAHFLLACRYTAWRCQKCHKLNIIGREKEGTTFHKYTLLNLACSVSSIVFAHWQVLTNKHTADSQSSDFTASTLLCWNMSSWHTQPLKHHQKLGWSSDDKTPFKIHLKPQIPLSDPCCSNTSFTYITFASCLMSRVFHSSVWTSM